MSGPSSYRGVLNAMAVNTGDVGVEVVAEAVE